MTATYRLLLLADDPDAAVRVTEAARVSAAPDISVTHVHTLADALMRLREESYDIVLSELNLTDVRGLDVVRSLQRAASYCPVVVLSAEADEAVILEMLREGADDVLVRAELGPASLRRVVRHTIERRLNWQRVQAGLEEDVRAAAVLQRLGTALTAELDLQRAAQLAIDGAQPLTGAAFAAFFYHVTDAHGETYMLYALAGVARAAFATFPNPRNTPLFGATLVNGEVVRSDDVTQEPLFGRQAPHHGLPPGHLAVRSYLAVPVISRTAEILGGMFFGHPEPARFSDREERRVTGIAAWAAVALDNARQSEAERAVRRRTEQESRAKSAFLSNLSRELRTPLNAMIGYTDLWLLGLPVVLPAEIQPQVQRIRRSAQHVLALVEEMVTYSGREAAYDRLDLKPVSLLDELETVSTFIEPLALEKRLLYSTEAPGRPVTLVTDARKLRQILVSLLYNAVQRTDSGAIGLRVEEQPGTISFVVWDSGPGLVRAEPERVFDLPVATVLPGADEPASGLSAARRLARLLGGDVTSGSGPGPGSMFKVHLPLEANPLPQP
jgi:signal transduction histidine kinase/DNA-binding response OmpR family regulator